MQPEFEQDTLPPPSAQPATPDQLPPSIQQSSQARAASAIKRASAQPQPQFKQPGLGDMGKSLLQGLTQRVELTGSVGGYIDRGTRFVQDFLARIGKPVDTIFMVAQQRYAQGEYKDASMRLQMVLRFQPNNVQALYLLGASHLALREDRQAAQAFRRALTLNPNHEEAKFMLCIAEPNAYPHAQQPKIAPLSIAAQHFDNGAEWYDTIQLDELNYQGHRIMHDAVRKYLNPQFQSLHILDIGCGTGLVGTMFHAIAGRMDGVDISRNMIAIADARRDNRERRIYDALHLQDLRYFMLNAVANSYDLLLAANVFSYVGALTPVFDGAAHVLKPGGVFAFSFDLMQGSDFGLVPGEGRYAHSDAYIQEQAQRTGFEILERVLFPIYQEAEAVQYLLRKPVPGEHHTQPPQAPQTEPQE